MEIRNERSTWSKEEIEALLAREDFAYQDIELPFGLRTGGHDRSATAARIFPDDLTGKTVLDLGCSFGFFCFEALRRGAKRVVGFDVDPDSVRKAKLLAECMGAEVEFAQRDIERDPIDERFDYVLCLNLLHHLKDPIAALDNLAACANERLILELASFGRHDRRKVNVGWFTHKILSKLPIIFVSRYGTRGRHQVQKFFISPSATENLLIYQRGMFARLQQHPSEHKNRYIAIAEKRRIGHLLVVSGPTSAGKKSLMRALVANQVPELNRRLGTPDGSIWGVPLNGGKIFQPMEPVQEHLILHQDFMRPFMRSAMVHERDETNDILDTAEKITFVTVWTPPEQLIKQITEAEIEPAFAKGKKAKRHLAIRDLYHRPEKVIDHYERWFTFAETKSRDHIVVSPHDGTKLYSIAEWRRLFGTTPGTLRQAAGS
ncbi:methyltransferase domain-containing protein [Pelagibius sp.]|uniref:methyltransferase domain-containing protein n=1 Tax=Pelagibius sp. TaxID=1931238 RepID=UPI003B50170D